MNHTQEIINKFGGLTSLSKMLGHKNPTTVQGWKERGIVPARQQIKLLKAARKHGIDLKPDDFFKDIGEE